MEAFANHTPVESQCIIFSHYGYTPYLDYTLGCAAKTNPNVRKVLLGDGRNKAVADRNGWEHFLYSDFLSPNHERFHDIFKPIRGNLSAPNDKWLKFVFERWLHIDGFIRSEGINRFWHFDSDTMIVRNLENYSSLMNDYDYTTQCNGMQHKKAGIM